MSQSIRKDALHATGVILAASLATFATAVAITMSGPAFAASHDYRFEVAQVASAAPGKSDVTVRLVRAVDGSLVANADLSANAATDTVAEQAGYRRFRVETATAGPQTLQVSAKVPGPTRIERTFNTSIKATLERKSPWQGQDRHRRRRLLRPMTSQLAGQAMIRRNILMSIVAIAATSASSAPALAWNAVQSTEQAPYAGRVVKVDAGAGKIMIEHRPIWRLYMESMTMIFKVRDGAVLTGLTPGDKIRFKVRRAGDGFVVTWIENSN